MLRQQFRKNEEFKNTKQNRFKKEAIKNEKYSIMQILSIELNLRMYFPHL
jgi:hypothetical protein